ncbi:MAG: DUF4112 domain-containing protein [Acidobacteria bacterium]|nr:DUF4112 domain-containing protein [Acidobacteriota bacterium]
MVLGNIIAATVFFATVAAAAYVVVRFWFVRLAEPISAQIATQIERATDKGVARLRGQPTASQVIEASAAVGATIREFAAARGLDIDEARGVFLSRLDRVARLMDRAFPLPLVGDIFDLVFNANTRNIALLEAYLEEGRRRGSSSAPALAVV